MLKNTTTPDMLRTVKQRAISMSELVYGRPSRRPRFPGRIVFLAAFGAMSIGCATAPRPTETETVGALTASATHVTTAPLKHDPPPEFAGVVGSDSDDVTSTVTTVTVANPSNSSNGSELPDIAVKTDGVTTGTVR